MDLIANTADMLTCQVKGNLDKNMIERNVLDLTYNLTP